MRCLQQLARVKHNTPGVCLPALPCVLAVECELDSRYWIVKQYASPGSLQPGCLRRVWMRVWVQASVWVRESEHVRRIHDLAPQT